MKPVKPPPLLPCCDRSIGNVGLLEPTFRELFGYLYVDGQWYVSLPDNGVCRLRFRPRHFDHAFFKEGSGDGERTVWQPKRAERLLWIGYTLEQPAGMQLVGTVRYNFFCRMADREAPWYLVVTDLYSANQLDFVTAYPLDHASYGRLSKRGTMLR